jgi:putative SbcD/Mre11-related phosphoesterase
MVVEIFDGSIEIIDSYPAIYIPTIDSIVISDLHLGYERIMSERGVFIPEIQFKEEVKALKKIMRIKRAYSIIINGDLKNEFSPETYHEFEEVSNMLNFLKRNFKRVVVVKGNHDTYIYYVTNRFSVELHDPYYLEKGFLFTHGHKKIEYPKNFHTLIIGHEEPAIVLKEGFDRIKVPVLLYGKMKNGKNIICLPAFSILSSGTEINVIEKEEILSPILREDVDLDELNVIAIDKEAGALNFGKLKNLRI